MLARFEHEIHAEAIQGASGMFGTGQVVFLYFCEERLVVNPERLSGLGLVAAAGIQDASDVQTFDIVKRLSRLIRRQNWR